MNPPSIRPITPADAEQLAPLWRASIRELCGQDHGGDPALVAAWCANKTASELRRVFADSAVQWRLAEDERGQPLGLAGLKDDEIVACYVAPASAGRGVGKALLAHLIALARRAGRTRLHLFSTATAQGFYARLGFRPNGKIEHFLGRIRACGMELCTETHAHEASGRGP